MFVSITLRTFVSRPARNRRRWVTHRSPRPPTSMPISTTVNLTTWRRRSMPLHERNVDLVSKFVPIWPPAGRGYSSVAACRVSRPRPVAAIRAPLQAGGRQDSEGSRHPHPLVCLGNPLRSERHVEESIGRVGLAVVRHVTTGVPLHHHHPDRHETAWRTT